MGQFKRGKSTFINALLGTETAPTAIVPLTSIVALLCFGPQPRAVKLSIDELRAKTAKFEEFVRQTEKEHDEHRFILTGQIRERLATYRNQAENI